MYGYRPITGIEIGGRGGFGEPLPPIILPGTTVVWLRTGGTGTSVPSAASTKTRLCDCRFRSAPGKGECKMQPVRLEIMITIGEPCGTACFKECNRRIEDGGLSWEKTA